MSVSINDIPDEIIREYDLKTKATKDGMVYIKANHGMYGLPQAGRLANELLEKRFNRHGYHQSTLCLAFGYTSGDQCNVHSWWKILE